MTDVCGERERERERQLERIPPRFYMPYGTIAAARVRAPALCPFDAQDCGTVRGESFFFFFHCCFVFRRGERENGEIILTLRVC